MITVYGRRDSSNSAKVLWLLDLLGVPFDLALRGGAHGGTDLPAYRRLNPHGKVPTLEVLGEVRGGAIWESNACLRYLATAHRAEALFPSDPLARAGVDMWMDWASMTLTPPLTRLRKAMAAGQPADAAPVVAAFQVLDRALAERDFIAGDALTLADISAAPAVYRAGKIARLLPHLPAVDRYRDQLSTLAGYRTHIAESLS